MKEKEAYNFLTKTHNNEYLKKYLLNLRSQGQPNQQQQQAEEDNMRE